MKDKERESGPGDSDKVLSMDRWRENRGAGENPGDETLTDLLNHMRRMREVVPVNRNLQEELRKRLLMQGAAGSGQVPATVIEPVAASTPRNMYWSLLTVLVLLVGAVSYWALAGGGSTRSLEMAEGPQEIARFWSGEFSASLGLPDDKYLVVRNGNLVLMSLSGATFGIIEAADDNAFLDVAVSPGGAKVAVVRQVPGAGTEIVVFPTDILITTLEQRLPPPETPQKMWVSDQASEVEGLSWSPDGQKLAFATLDAGGTAKVWVSVRDSHSQMSGLGLSQGLSPTWSPDGKSLVVQKSDPDDGDTLWLVPLEGEQSVYLGRGRSPAWSSGGYLVYLTTRIQEKVLSYTTDGLPQFTVRQPVDEVRWLNLGKYSRSYPREDGLDIMADSKLLLIPGQLGAGSDQELLWLRQLELSGQVEPEVLSLEQDSLHHSMTITEDGQKLYLLRDTVGPGSGGVNTVLIEVLLGERRGSEVESR